MVTTSSSPSAFGTKPKAEAIRDKCLGKPGIVTEESKPSNVAVAVALRFDQFAARRELAVFGFSAKNTLGLAQALYERHKVLTYPRTDSRALPEDYLGTVKNALKMLGETGLRDLCRDHPQEQLGASEQTHLHNAKVSDHFAIIPTTQTPHGLSEPERKLYD